MAEPGTSNGLIDDFFLKLSGIEGESQDAKHSGEIQVLGFEMGLANRGRRGDYKVGKVTFDDAKFRAYIDQSCPKLQLACATGDHLATAVLTVRKQGKIQQEYLKITLSDCVVTSCKVVTHDPNDLLPMMEFSLSFSKKQIEYREQKQDGGLGGAITASVDIKKNTAVSA
jgi:type VI secretion system secreted protein Hcp